MAVARAKGKPRGKKPELSGRQQKELRRMHDSGDYSIGDLAEPFAVSRPTVYRTLHRQAGRAVANARSIARPSYICSGIISVWSPEKNR
jgi:DNA invertase Pin-like site-specific DNA recombinase